jgi:hypothetical protein
LQQIADALDVSTTKTFQFTGKVWHVGQSTSPMAACRDITCAVTRMYDFSGSDARTNGPDAG